jgi:hypothetical protein
MISKFQRHIDQKEQSENTGQIIQGDYEKTAELFLPINNGHYPPIQGSIFPQYIVLF